MSLQSLINKYQLAIQMFGAETLHSALKKAYNDNLYYSDIIVNILIDILYININIPVHVLMRKLSVIHHSEMYRYYLEDTLDLWIQSKNCPFEL